MDNRVSIAFVTLGCKLNYAETSTYERALVAAGWEVVPWTDTDADFYLVNTCSVTEHSDKKSRNIIRKLHRTSPRAGIVVTGCSAQLRKEEIEKIEGVAKVFGSEEKSMVVPWLLEARKGQVVECPAQQESYFRAFSTGERTRSFLKVQDGCDYKCHYCTVPYARGCSRNAPISDILEDAAKIAETGIKEVVITGVNTGDFGKSTGEDFFSLLKALNTVDGIERFRISSIEPNLLTGGIVDWIASGQSKVLPHFHIPLQSGCDEILERMGRRYRTADFAAKISYIREKLEKEGEQKVFFGIDVIVGFPGETDELFKRTYDFLKDTVKPAFIHIFPYSRRPGTPAASMKGQVQDSIKTARVEALEALCNRLHNEFVEANRGVRSKVLYEQMTKDGMIEGWSENYIKVTRPVVREDGTLRRINEIENVIL